MASQREQLIRQNFEAYRDFTWLEDLEPKFRERGVDGKELQLYREAWNERAEKRDWAWWQDELADSPDGSIRADTRNVLARMERLREAGLSADRSFDDMLAESAYRAPASDKEEEMER
jgi:hypothetical protein